MRSREILEFSIPARTWRPRRKLLLKMPAPGRVLEARATLDRLLVELKDSIPKLEIADADAADVYEMLRRTGMLMMLLLFDQAEDIDKIQQFFTRAMADRPGATPPLIECVGDIETLLPIEYLPLFVPRRTRRIANRAGLVEACRHFAGFSCVIRRSFAEAPVAQGRTLEPGAEGRIPVRFLRHDGLPGAAAELAWLTGPAREHVEIERAYPSGDENEPGLVDLIWDPALSLTGAAGREPDQIQHFACHCHTRADDPLGNEIELSGDGRTVVTRLDDLGIELTDRRMTRAARTGNMPLIFMNACGASRMAATSALSFPSLFLHGNRNRGFIGSDVEVPDDVASEFSAAFYTAFILRRRPLGESVHHARNHLLARFGNPLGLGYAAYADPDLHIRPWESS
ncbi:CHAT domain-containing protein [Actinoplanes bogorensis]|uniref:CHAT domain-containing protein n=1 Tax=Paractinoplanes bogorensis TaxID=1610840 RepID=A0ABS5YI28_9ACTN|nr:CHAT domain-containing protein [Actinoplanes bogorensis]MBU2662691.1 CHAT domain-containing protein [Actinoplanes bogorensis]